MFGLFNKKNKVENKDVRVSKSKVKKTAGDDVVLGISEDELSKIVGGSGCKDGDVREGISAANADQGYAAGEMNDVDGWD